MQQQGNHSMKKNENLQQQKRPQLRLIHGGQTSANTDVLDAWQSTLESSTRLTADAEHLRHEILCAWVEEFHQSVDEVLRELNEKVESEKREDCSRFFLLSHSLDRRGLTYMVAPPHLDLDCKGYLALSNVKKLLALHPELSSHRPEEHQLMTIGELPPLFKRSLLPSSQGSVRFCARKPKQKRGGRVASEAGYFDVLETSVWGQESNRLRHAILALELMAT